MPLFRPRTRVEILRDMIARVIARSKLVGLVRNSVVFHILAAAADEDAEQYYQLANLRLLFSIDTATGSDLDQRAREIKPSTITRETALFASGQVSFFRNGIVGTTTIPAGTIVAAKDSLGQIQFRTTTAAQIVDGFDTVINVNVVALEAGARGNVQENTISQFVSRVPGVTSVTNPNELSNGRDRESDSRFRARLKLFVQSLSRGTPTAIKAYSLNVQLADGRQVIFARVVEPLFPTGLFDVYIDDGTGTSSQYDETYFSTDDILINPAVGGEENLYTTLKPIYDDGTFRLWINGSLKTRNVDYFLNPARGQIELVSALIAGDNVAAQYRNYIGLVAETQKVLEGVIGGTELYPGVRAGGVQAIVKPAVVAWQSLTAAAAVADDYDAEQVIEEVEAAVLAYINGLDIGAHVIVSEIIERAMSIDGMFNFQISDLSGTFPAVDQIILPYQVARITSANLTIV
jgi:uncharacterized phage protein gp47/JayE